jgi:hypothetical protein
LFSVSRSGLDPTVGIGPESGLQALPGGFSRATVHDGSGACLRLSRAPEGHVPTGCGVADPGESFQTSLVDRDRRQRDMRQHRHESDLGSAFFNGKSNGTGLAGPTRQESSPRSELRPVFHSAGFARFHAARFGALCPKPTTISSRFRRRCRRSCGLRSSRVLIRPGTPVAQSWCELQITTPGRLVGFLPPYEEIRASQY